MMMTAEEPSHFGHLPVEMISEVFDLIPFREKKKARLVCHLWRMMVDSHRSVSFRPKLTNNASMKDFLNSYRYMDKVIMRNIDLEMSKEAASDYEFLRIKNAELGWKNSEENIVRFLKDMCKCAESLTIAKFSLEKINGDMISKMLSEFTWNYLTRFNLIVEMTRYKDDRAIAHLDNAITFLRSARIPNLLEFDFNFYFSYGFSEKLKHRFPNLLLGLYEFLVTHAKTLEVLAGSVNTTSQRKLEIPEIQKDLQDQLESTIQLKRCTLTFGGVKYLDLFFSPTSFGSELKSLDLKILPTVGADHNPNNLYGNIGEIIQRNVKLNDISLEMEVIGLGWIQNCTSLESLKLQAMSEIREPSDMNISQIKLKTFLSIGAFGFENSMTPGVRQLLIQSSSTLQQLGLFRADISLIPVQFSPVDFSKLKSLKFYHIFPEFFTANVGDRFLQITELETFLLIGNVIATKITEFMKNLEFINIISPWFDVLALQTLLMLPKLKQLSCSAMNLWNGPNPNEIIQHCKTIPGLKLNTTKVKRTGRTDFEKRLIITKEKSTSRSPALNILPQN